MCLQMQSSVPTSSSTILKEITTALISKEMSGKLNQNNLISILSNRTAKEYYFASEASCFSLVNAIDSVTNFSLTDAQYFLFLKMALEILGNKLTELETTYVLMLQDAIPLEILFFATCQLLRLINLGKAPRASVYQGNRGIHHRSHRKIRSRLVLIKTIV